MLTGRFSESWMPTEGAVNNAIHAESWDGATLGSQWRVWCPAIVSAPVLISDTRVAGTGDAVYRTIYGGGRFWLSSSGPWSADNLADFTGDVTYFVVVSTHQFLMGNLNGIRSNITLIGIFDQLYPSWNQSCMDYSIDNGSVTGYAPSVKPADYPGFINYLNCPAEAGDGNLSGAWGSVTNLTLVITGCSVPAQPSTWGAVKLRY